MFLFFVFRIFSGGFDTSGSMIPLSVSEISALDVQDEELCILVVGYIFSQTFKPSWASFYTDDSDEICDILQLRGLPCKSVQEQEPNEPLMLKYLLIKFT